MDPSASDRPESSESDPARWFALVDEVRRRLGPGTPLSPTARRFFQGHLGGDAGGVLIHRGPFAGYLSGGLSAAAASASGHVFGADAALSEDSPEGASLLGHELVHATGPIQRAPGDASDTDDPEERRAEAMEALVTEIVSDLESDPAEEPAPRTQPVDVHALAELVYERIVHRLRDERDRGAW